MTKDKIQQIVFITAGLLTIIGSIAQIAGIPHAVYIFATGTLLLIYSHLKSVLSSKDDGFRTRRLSRIGFISSLMLLAADYFMFTGSNAWVVCLLIYAVITFVLSFRSE